MSARSKPLFSTFTRASCILVTSRLAVFLAHEVLPFASAFKSFQPIAAASSHKTPDDDNVLPLLFRLANYLRATRMDDSGQDTETEQGTPQPNPKPAAING